MKNQIRILLVDDHPVVRKGLASCLAQQSNLEVVGEAANGQEALRKAKELTPDVVVMDIDMPQMDGLAVTDILRKELPHIRVLIMSMHRHTEYVLRILQSGARGYVLKDASPDELVKAIETVHAGESFFSRDVARLALNQFVRGGTGANGVNLTDGLDGLASGASVLVLAAFVIIAFWQFRHACGAVTALACYGVDPSTMLDIAVVAAAMMGAATGFLWWNAAPARIFMGDTGSLALGGGIAGLAILTSTQLLLVVLGGLFVLETTSVIMQVIAFRGFRRRIFKMAPLHHHFELGGWPEFTVIVRFWIIAGLAAALGLGLFYAEFLSKGGPAV